jgi:acetyltransferase (GNAT) family protein
MKIGRSEYFGTQSQQKLQQRADQLWALVANDPDYACHGRAVSLVQETETNLDKQIALARLQGGSGRDEVRNDVAQDRRRSLEAQGMVMDENVRWEGQADTLRMARSVMAENVLQDDLEIISVDSNTSVSELAKLDALTQSCDVLLPMGSFIRGERRPSVCLFAKDRQGNVVGTTASVAQYHPDHAKAGMAWWGMLATHTSRRGERIALILGAHSLIAMYERYGYQEFFTGIREGNIPSAKLCEKLGLAATDSIVQLTIDPETFGGSQITK